MKEKNTASPSSQKNILRISAIVAILLLLIFAFWNMERTSKSSLAPIGGTAAITLWSTDTGTVSSLLHAFKRTPDYEIAELETGFVSERGEFVPSETLYSGFKGAVRIRVSNNAKNGSEPWHIEADLPTRMPYTYVSDTFPPLVKHETKTFLLTFDSVTHEDQGTISIKIVSGEKEKNNKNNTSERVVSVAQ